MAAADYSTVAQQIYIAYFGRPADPTGLANVEAALNAAGAPTNAADLSAAYNTNAGIKSLIDSFGTSAESASLYTGTTTQFVNAIYHDLFNRGADLSGLNFWVQAIDSGSLTRAHAAQSILAGAAAPDAAIVAAKVVASNNFTAALNTGDTLAAYSGNAAAAAARTLLSNVDASTDQVAFQTQINSTITALVAGPVQNLALTAGVDTIVGGANNDIISAINTGTPSTTTWSALDTIDGGKGVNTLNLSDTATGGGVDLSLVSVKNIQILNVNSVGVIANADVTGYTGLTTAAFSFKNPGTVALTTAETIKVSDTTAVTATNNGTGDVVVNGGSTATVTGAAVITVNGGKALTSANIVGGTTINVNDSGNATLTSVSLKGETAAAATLTSDSLTNVSLTSVAGTVGIANNVKHALTLGVNGSTGVTVTDAHATTVALNVTGAKATTAAALTLTTNAATEIDINTAAALTLTSNDTALKTVTVAGAGSFTSDLSGSSVTSIDASASTGANTVTLATTTAYVGGSGVDTVKIAAVSTQSVDGGAGAADVLNFTGTAGTLTATTGAKFVGFEVLDVTGVAAAGSYDVSTIAGITALQAGAIGGSVVFNKVAAGDALNLTAAPGTASTVTYNLAADTVADALTVNLGTAATDLATTTFASVVATGIEALTINTLGKVDATTGFGTDHYTLAVTDASATSLTLTGAESVSVTGLSALTTIDATGVAKGAAVVIASGETVSTGGVTVTVGDADFTFTGTSAAGKVDTITAGNGVVHITELSGNNVITIGDGAADSVNVTGNGNNTIVVGNGAGDIISVGNGNNTITGGTGAETITVGTGQNTITVGAHTAADTFALGIAATANSYSTITGAAHGDIVNLDVAGTHSSVFAGGTAATAQISLNAGTAAFADYVLAATSIAGAGATGTIAGGAGEISWFNFGGNTYIVEDNSAANGFVTGADNIVQLTGVVNLAATGSVATTASGHVVL
jgi:hypothetical protein